MSTSDTAPTTDDAAYEAEARAEARRAYPNSAVKQVEFLSAALGRCIPPGEVFPFGREVHDDAALCSKRHGRSSYIHPTYTSTARPGTKGGR